MKRTPSDCGLQTEDRRVIRANLLDVQANQIADYTPISVNNAQVTLLTG